MTFWEIGRKLDNGKYVVEQELGRGAFGITYRVREIRTDRLFAVKTLNESLQRRTDFQAIQVKFVNEAIRLAKCSHPNIADVTEVFMENQLWCMVMEYIDGQELADYLRQQGTLSEAEAINIINQIGSALTCVHEKNILHRDIKPENIILRKSDLSPVLVDFGLARELIPNLTLQSMSYNGTLFYAPIEESEQKGNFGAWTDIYALAATLYVLLVGREKIPNQLSTVRKIEYLTNKKDPLPTPKQMNSNLSDRINEAILKGMEIEPGDRPQSITEFLNLLPSGHNYFNKGNQLIDNSLYEDAIKCFDQAIDVDANNHEYWNQKGIALYALRKYKDAIVCLKKAIDIKYDYHIAWSNTGDALRQLNNHEKAIDFYNIAIRIKPNFYEAYFAKALAFRQLKLYEEKLSCYNEAIAINSGCDYIWHYRGIVLNKIKQDKEALKSFFTAIEINSYYHESWYAYGISLIKLKQYKKALFSLERATEINPYCYEYWYAHGISYYLLEHYDQALSSIKKAIEINYSHYEAWLMKGRILYYMRHHREAIFAYTKAIEINPNIFIIWYQKGMAHYAIYRNCKSYSIYVLITLYHYHKARSFYFKALKMNFNDSVYDFAFLPWYDIAALNKFPLLGIVPDLSK